MVTQEESAKFKNIAQHQATVGIQAGIIKGNVTTGTVAQATLQDQLTELRADLLAARERHELDIETFAAAEEELATAYKHSGDGSGGGRGKLVIALKRLKGLVDGIADLGAKVAAIIAAVHGL